MLRIVLQLVILVCAVTVASSWKASFSRKSVGASLRKGLGPLIVGAGMVLSDPSSASAIDRDVYFGVGCFWHVQHEFVQAEQNILGRDIKEVTSAAGYAGSTKLGKDSRDPTSKGIVCYHNLLGEGDYGKLGHGEVVGMKIPESKGK